MQRSNVLATYAAYSKDDEIRRLSSSGAVFSLFAEHILSLNGVVYGVAMTNDCRDAEFIRVDNINELSKLRGSKYLQAKMRNTFRLIKQDLENKIIVLFTGVGCQVNGLKAFLGKNYENLLCVDVICHGVSSPALWRKYVEDFEKINKAKLVSVNFRCKDTGWVDFGIKKRDTKQCRVYISKDQDSYMQMFLRNYCLRPSCYECVAKKEKCSDVTIADFWGIEKVAQEMNDNKGISLVIIRTNKGSELFKQVEDRLFLKPVKYHEGVKENPCEYESVKRPIQRNMFFDDMNTMSFFELENKYLPVSWKGKIKRVFFRTHLRKIFKGGGIPISDVKCKNNNNYGVLLTFEKGK